MVSKLQSTQSFPDTQNHNESKVSKIFQLRHQLLIHFQQTLHLQNGLSRVPEPLCLLISEMDICDTQNSTPSNLRRQAQENVPIDAIEPLCKDRNWVDLPLVSKHTSRQISHRVPNCPRSVAFQSDHFIRALYYCFVNVL